MGLSSEWIVEVPDSSPHVPLFNPVTFSECTAGSYAHGIFHLTGGYINEIRVPQSSSPYPLQISQSSIASETEAVVKEIAVDWF